MNDRVNDDIAESAVYLCHQHDPLSDEEEIPGDAIGPVNNSKTEDHR